jgi:hypothetical protein
VYFQDPERLAFQRGVAYAELGRYVDAVPLLATALEGLAEGYERDRARYAAQLALALAGTGDADAAFICLTQRRCDILFAVLRNKILYQHHAPKAA